MCIILIGRHLLLSNFPKAFYMAQSHAPSISHCWGSEAGKNSPPNKHCDQKHYACCLLPAAQALLPLSELLGFEHFPDFVPASQDFFDRSFRNSVPVAFLVSRVTGEGYLRLICSVTCPSVKQAPNKHQHLTREGKGTAVPFLYD